AVDEASGAVDGINDPDTACIKGRAAGFFTEKTVVRELFGQLLLDERLGFLVDNTDQILELIAFMADDQRIAFLVMPKRAARSFHGELLGERVTFLQSLGAQWSSY